MTEDSTTCAEANYSDSLDADDGSPTGGLNVGRPQQSISQLQLPRELFLIKGCYFWVQIIFLLQSNVGLPFEELLL